MSSLLSEFKQFAMRGNVVDLAVGVIMGGAFGKIVSSLVADVVMPLLGLIVGGVNFSDLVLVLKRAEDGAPMVTLQYGMFLQSVFDFGIVALAIFIFIKGMNRLQAKPAPAPAATPNKEEILLAEIRDILKNK